MKIKNILSNIDYEILQGNDELDIEIIENDSRKVVNCDKNTMFVCISGMKFDGHAFVEEAIKNDNIRAFLVEKDIFVNNKNVTVIKVKDTRSAMQTICFNFYNNPQNNMKVVGVTGTSGKTSTTIIIETVLRNVGIKSAVIGTLGHRIGNEPIPVNKTTVTTPDSLELAKMFNYINEQGVKYTVMEATSHALSLNRVDMINFEVGIFTNLGIEHLDFHKTQEEYAEAKFKLFNLSKKAVINIDDKYGKEFYNRINKQKLSLSLEDKSADLYAYNVNITPNGTYFDLKYNNKEYKNIFINLVGRFSVYNTLSAIATALLLDVKIDDIVNGLNNIDYIGGRCESVNNDKGINIIIDYAHTAEQFENILKAMKQFTKNKLISLFGCGGDRDNSKRPLMGEVAGKYSNFVVVAEDNPRSEDPNVINSQIEVGLKKTGTEYKLFVNRKDAIEFALSMAEKGDTFIMMGKGPEKYQEYANAEKKYFCEREVVEEWLKNN
ncbi:MAG: UDP-N-acetylmuramoyl-L-alanyl-D-glutamate--2,6-diaminopimelate ligase [Rickettsiales bacterium]|nr:UDP-N-acetylmuramoyl-L-alanyl-D-glutamate--2,6-diaminopimelate ligase [Rickettsiales bacterium]